MSNELDQATTIDEVIARVRRLAQRYPAIVPVLHDLVRGIEQCVNLSEEDAIACLRFHCQQPRIADPLMRLAQIVRGQAIGRHHNVEVDDDDDDTDYDDWVKKSTILA